MRTTGRPSPPVSSTWRGTEPLWMVGIVVLSRGEQGPPTIGRYPRPPSPSASAEPAAGPLHPGGEPEPVVQAPGDVVVGEHAERARAGRGHGQPGEVGGDRRTPPLTATVA